MMRKHWVDFGGAITRAGNIDSMHESNMLIKHMGLSLAANIRGIFEI